MPQLLFWSEGLGLSCPVDRASLGELRCGANFQQGDAISPLNGGSGKAEGNSLNSHVDDLG